MGKDPQNAFAVLPAGVGCSLFARLIGLGEMQDFSDFLAQRKYAGRR